MAQPTKRCPKCGARYHAAATYCQNDGVRLETDGEVDPLLGMVLLDQFRLEEQIGTGGMGRVYRAHQIGLGRDVAVKVLHPELTEDPDAVRRFRREAKVATSLEHPNLVRVFLFGELELSSDQRSLYMVMEYLVGEALNDRLADGPMREGDALHIMAQLCDAIGAAHEKGVVHRDVKPENIVLVRRGGDPIFVKLLDFGIARLLHDEGSHMTQTGLIFGTARYISPEGAAGEATDARSDVYSLGVLLYQMLSGQTPFSASTPVAMLMKHVEEAPPELRTLMPDIDGALHDVIMRSLEKKPNRRYANAHEFGMALRTASGRRSESAWSDDSQVTRPSRHSLEDATPVLSRVANETAEEADEETDYTVPTRFPLSRIAIAFVVGVLLVVGAVLGQRTLTPPDPEADLVQVMAALEEGRLRGDDGVFALMESLEEAETEEQTAARVALRERALEALLQQAEGEPREEALGTLEFAEELGADLARLESIRERFVIIEPSLNVSPTTLTIGGEVSVSFRVPAEATEVSVALVAGSQSLLLDTESENSERTKITTTNYVFRRAGTYVLRARYVLGEEHIELSEALTVTGNTRRSPRPAFRSNMRPDVVQVEVEPPGMETAEPWVDEPEDNGIDWSLPGSGGPGGSGAPSGSNGSAGTTASPWTGDG